MPRSICVSGGVCAWGAREIGLGITSLRAMSAKHLLACAFTVLNAARGI